jgi:hypothetical protein
MPLVFHIRASGDSPQATDALYREVLGLTVDKVPNTTTCLPRIVEYHSLSSETPPFGPISLLPPVQSLSIGNTCSEDIKVPNTLQSIHLHCFNGDEATVKLWSDAYPGTHFGFSSMVKGFGDRPRRGLRAVPGNRLLLESDSLQPLTPRSPHKCSHDPSCTTCLPRIVEYHSLSSETLPFGPSQTLVGRLPWNPLWVLEYGKRVWRSTKEGAESCSRDRLLLESDSPHLPDVAMMPHALPVSPEYLNTTIIPKESPNLCSHDASCTTCLP